MYKQLLSFTIVNGYLFTIQLIHRVNGIIIQQYKDFNQFNSTTLFTRTIETKYNIIITD